MFNSDHIDLQNQLIDKQKEQMMVSAINGNNGISYVNQRVQEQAERDKAKKRPALEQIRNVSSSLPVIHNMSTRQSDDEMDDADEMDYDDAPNMQDPSSSSTSRPKVKPLSKKSKEKAQRDAEKAKDRKVQTANPYVETPYVDETLHPKPTIKPKFDEVGRNTLTDKKAVLDYDTRVSYWSRQNAPYIKNQLLLRGHKFSEVGKMKTKGEMLAILHEIDKDGL